MAVGAVAATVLPHPDMAKARKITSTVRLPMIALDSLQAVYHTDTDKRPHGALDHEGVCVAGYNLRLLLR